MVKGLQTIGGKWYYMDTEGRMAVSYTHLDVYKRQVFLQKIDHCTDYIECGRMSAYYLLGISPKQILVYNQILLECYTIHHYLLLGFYNMFL